MRPTRLIAVAAALAAVLGAGPAAAAPPPPATRTLEVDTSPATPGLKLVYRGRTYVADAQGKALIDVSATPAIDDPIASKPNGGRLNCACR